MKKVWAVALFVFALFSGLGGAVVVWEFLMKARLEDFTMGLSHSAWFAMAVVLICASVGSAGYSAYITFRRRTEIGQDLLLAPDGTLELIEARPELATDPGLKWKRKLRVILRNHTAQQATAPDWISNRGSIPFQPPFWSILQSEDKAAGGWKLNRWNAETQSLALLQPGDVFQASVGLHDHFGVEEINTRRQTQRVGVLLVPVKIDGREMVCRMSL